MLIATIKGTFGGYDSITSRVLIASVYPRVKPSPLEVDDTERA